MCSDDAQQLGNIQEAWNNLAKQLTAAQQGSCMAPDTVPSGTLDYPTKAKLMMDTLALCVACDRARVLSLQFSTSTSNLTHTWVNAGDSATHHQHSHTGPSSEYTLGTDIYNIATYNPPNVAPMYDSQLAQIETWYGNQVAYLAQKLSSLNVLSNSVICWGNELDMGNAHNHVNTTFTLIGGCGGALKTGQLVQFPMNLGNNLNNPPMNNRFHNDLLVTLANAMGVNMTTFGTAIGSPPGANGNVYPFVTGPIKEILPP